MIKANHNIVAQIVFYSYIKKLMKKHFSHFYLVNESPEISMSSSLVITPNHISWWDGFFIGLLEKKYYNRKVHIMMLEDELKKYWFFSKVGAYSIKHNSIKSIRESQTYTKELISQPSNSIIIYPQGEIEDFGKRPLTLKKGLKYFIEDSGNNVSILPVGFKIQYYNEMKPSIVVRFGRPLDNIELVNDFRLYEKEFYSNLEQLSKAIEAKNFISDLFSERKK